MTEYSATELEAIVRRRGPEIARNIRQAAQRAKNEAELVAEVEKVVERFARSFDVTLRLDRERTLINGRADAVYNRFVVEYEPPGSLRKSNIIRPISTRSGRCSSTSRQSRRRSDTERSAWPAWSSTGPSTSSSDRVTVTGVSTTRCPSMPRAPRCSCGTFCHFRPSSRSRQRTWFATLVRTTTLLAASCRPSIPR